MSAMSSKSAWSLTPVLAQLSVLASLVVIGACNDPKSKDGDSAASDLDTYTAPADEDGDGWSTTDGDCDDTDATVYPGADELCNGEDDNCNDAVDETFPDSDYDGIADCNGEVEECDGLDNDGDGEIDEDFEDLDGDGIPDCEAPEICDGIDNDGDGEIDEGFDADGDGYTECGDETTAADCDDTDAAVNPGASEIADDLVDNDCNGLVDEGAWAAGDLFITEIMQNPAGVLDPSGEWFEIYNNSDRTLVLNGLQLYSTLDGDWHQVSSPDLLLVDPDGYFVFGIEEDPFTNGGVTVDYVYEDLGLNNEIDEIVIEADGVLIDAVVWDDGDVFPDPDGRSMALDPAYYGADLNDDGTYWCQGTVRWATASDFGSPGDQNPFCWPTARASYDPSSSLETCDSIQLDGSGSADPSGLPLTYEWELTSAPAGSATTTADIVDPTDVNPVFAPDRAGTYVFALTVYNGVEYSPPASLSLTVTARSYNTSPVADAGDDEAYSEDSTCISISYGASYNCPDCADNDFDLDGSASTDPDGDWLTNPTWTILSDSTGTSTIADEDTWYPTLTMLGTVATYGTTNTGTVEVELEVTDCMGATDTDTVVITHNCTGT
jgi:hypothetical protein